MSSSARFVRAGRSSRLVGLVVVIASVHAVHALAAQDARPSGDAVREAANAARRAVREGEPDAESRIDAASALVDALPAAADDRLAIELHVVRTRMDWLAQAIAGVTKEGEVKSGATKVGTTMRGVDGIARFEALERELARIGEAARRRGEPGSRAWALVYGAELALARGDRAQAGVLLDGARLIGEGDGTWEAHIAAERLRARALLGEGDRHEAIRALSRAHRILARMRPRLELAVHLELAQPIHGALAGLLLDRAASAGAGADGATAEQQDLRAALELLEELKLAELRAHFGDACLADLATTTPERLPGTRLLYPVMLEDRVLLIVGAGGRLAHRAAPITPQALVAEIRSLRGALQDPTSPRHRASSARLYEALIEPVVSAWAALDGGSLGGERGDPKTLVVVPSGVLREIPFAALFDARTGRYLIEDVALATLPSLHVLPPAPLDGRRTRLLVAGLTEAVEDFSPLPFAARELESASARFPATRRLDAEFTKSAFAAALEAEPFDVVHIASHGRFDARASESFLLAHDGRIGMTELGEWIGRTRHRTGRPLELLVLSACETAIGDERAVLGLAGVAVQAGARSAVASLWKVHDEATMQLFSHFYRELGRPGVSRAEALRRAQRALLAEPRFRHPIYWSAFLMVNGWL